MLRAYGGCLGIRRAKKDVAGCDKPRGFASQAGFDPGISEWGNPARVMI
jgi:hypothetical protein